MKINNCCQAVISFKVRLEQEVVGIQWNEVGCSVTTRTGSTIHCQHSIVTIPLGVLQVGGLHPEQRSTQDQPAGKPQELIPTNFGERSFGGFGQPWAWKSQQSFPGMGRSLVGRGRGICEDCKIKVCHALFFYVFQSQNSSGKSVKVSVCRKTGLITYLDLLRYLEMSWKFTKRIPHAKTSMCIPRCLGNCCSGLWDQPPRWTMKYFPKKSFYQGGGFFV